MLHAIKVIFSVVMGWAVVLVLAVVLAFTRWRENRRELRAHPKDVGARETTVATASKSHSSAEANLAKSGETADGLAAR